MSWSLVNEFWTFFFSWHFSFKVSESISTQKIKKAKQVRRLPSPAAILYKGRALRVFGKRFFWKKLTKKSFSKKPWHNSPPPLNQLSFFLFFSVFSWFSFQNISWASILNPELCSISKYSRTILKRKHLKIQFSFYQEEEMQESQCLNLAQTVLSCIAETKPKKKTCTGYFTPFGKIDSSIHISAEVWLICFAFQNSKKWFKIGLFQVFPKWSKTEKSCRTLNLSISWNNIIPKSWSSFQNFGVFSYRNTIINFKKCLSIQKAFFKVKFQQNNPI